MGFQGIPVPFGRFVRLSKRHSLQGGVTSIEYALVGALIAMVIVGTVTTLGLTVEDFYTLLSREVSKAVGEGG